MARLRITGGRARGRVLREAIGPGVRPTTDRVREALFSMLGQDLSGQHVLDAFGGTGIVGLEAWSRGATVTLVERDRRALGAIRRRVAELGADCTVRGGDALRLAADLGTFDGVFVDPPYDDDIGLVLDALGPLATEWLVAEVRAGTSAPERVGALERVRDRDYGGTSLWLFRAT